jgi:hypothetical protein
MPRLLLVLIATLSALTFTLTLSARAWGEAQPPHPALRGFVEGCEAMPQPCWFGITTHPGNLESLEIAEAHLEREGYTVVNEGVTLDELQNPYRVYQTSDAATTCSITLTYDSDRNEVFRTQVTCLGKGVRTGDLMLIWGMPDYLNPDPYPFLVYESQSALVIIGSAKNLLSPLEAMLLPTNYYGHALRWHGLVPQWRICQLDEMSCSGGY